MVPGHLASDKYTSRFYDLENTLYLIPIQTCLHIIVSVIKALLGDWKSTSSPKVNTGKGFKFILFFP